jgi:two-component system sensor histidine kinase KdpD
MLGVRHRLRSLVPRATLILGAALSGLALLVLIALLMRLNAASAGFVLLAGVLLIAARMPLFVATTSAVAATFAYNYFFFPPKHTLVIEDPENWIALGAFLLTSLVANRLVVRERVQAEKAEASREQIAALYEMGVALLRKTGGMEEIGEAACRYLQRIGAASGGVVLFGASPQQQQVLAWTGPPITDEVEDLAAGAARHRRATDIPSSSGRDICVPLLVGGHATAALVVRGAAGMQSALDSASSVLSFAIEHERFLSERAHVEALRHASELKTSLIHAVAHDLKSPLTVLAMESEALEQADPCSDLAHAHVITIRDEVARLRRRVDNLLSVARVEAGAVRPRAEPTPAADLFRAARESLPTVLRAHVIRTMVDDDAGDLLVDPSLALEIVVNLIENAAEASDADSPIDLRATRSLEREGRVWIEVLDCGHGLASDQTRRLRAIHTTESTGGLGMDLSRNLAALSGGTVEWFERRGGGTIARFDAPSAPAVKEGGV